MAGSPCTASLLHKTIISAQPPLVVGGADGLCAGDETGAPVGCLPHAPACALHSWNAQSCASRTGQTSGVPQRLRYLFPIMDSPKNKLDACSLPHVASRGVCMLVQQPSPTSVRFF